MRNSARFGAYKDKQNAGHKFDIHINKKGKYNLIIVAMDVVSYMCRREEPEKKIANTSHEITSMIKSKHIMFDLQMIVPSILFNF